jgi:uncharacterized protein YceH (UPF0502 family)
VDSATPGERAEQTERELRAAKAELEIKNEYIADLEKQVDHLSAQRDGRLQVRLKVWVARHLPRQSR